MRIETLIYFLLWAALIVGMMRFGCGAHVMGHGHGRTKSGGGPAGSGGDLRWSPPETDRDPVCGMTVKTAEAKSSIYDGLVYYFCSSDCRDKFEASPNSYIKPTHVPPQTGEHQHGSHH